MTSIAEQTRKSNFSEQELSEMREIFALVPQVEKAVIFGSRAKGCASRGSDVDIAVLGKSLQENSLFRLSELLSEESDLPYFFDVVDYSAVEDGPLKEHIDRVGLLIYERSDAS